MAKLTQEEKAVGFQYVLEKNWEGLRAWMRKRNMPVDHDAVVGTLRKCMEFGDVAKATNIFRAAFDDMDPETENTARHMFAIFWRAAFIGGLCLIVLVTAALLKFLFS